MELCIFVGSHVKYFGTLLYRLSLGLHQSYWAKVHKTLREQQQQQQQSSSTRIKHGPMTLYISLLLVMIGTARGVLVLLYLDQLNLDQRVLLLTEIFPQAVRKQSEVLILSWSIFYLLTMALDSSRTTEQMAFLNILVIDEKEFGYRRRGLGQEEWLRFRKLRGLMITFLDWMMAGVMVFSWLMVCALAVYSGALFQRPLGIACYAGAYVMWAGALCYPIYPLMLAIILLAGFYIIQQKALLRQLTVITRGGILFNFI